MELYLISPLFGGRTAKAVGRIRRPATFPSLSKTARWMISSLIEGEEELDGLPALHLALTALVDTLLRAELGDKVPATPASAWPRGAPASSWHRTPSRCPPCCRPGSS